MEIVDGISNVLIALIRVGAVFRVIVCCIKIMVSEEDNAKYKNRLKSAIVFYVVAELVWVIKGLILNYYG